MCGHSSREFAKVDFKEAVLEGFRKSLVIRGRDTRAQFWCFALVCFPLLCVGPPFILLLLTDPTSDFGLTVAPFCFYGSYLVFGVPFVTAIIRRLHDVGKPGYLWLLWFIPVANFYLLWLLVKKGVIKKAN